MTFERGWAEDLSFPRWLNEKIWVAESALTPDDVYWGAALAACEMIRSGTVGFNDHYFYMDRVAEVVEQSGLKAMLAWCVFGIGDDKEIGPGVEAQLAFSREWHNRADGRIHTALGPHSPYVCPPEFLRRDGRDWPPNTTARSTCTSPNRRNRSITRANVTAKRRWNISTRWACSITPRLPRTAWR